MVKSYLFKKVKSAVNDLVKRIRVTNSNRTKVEHTSVKKFTDVK